MVNSGWIVVNNRIGIIKNKMIDRELVIMVNNLGIAMIGLIAVNVY